jgi:hypothetical protein
MLDKLTIAVGIRIAATRDAATVFVVSARSPRDSRRPGSPARRTAKIAPLADFEVGRLPPLWVARSVDFPPFGSVPSTDGFETFFERV